MRIESVRIQNFRSFSDETIDFNPYTCLLGENGAGKSNVLHALNLLFRDPQYPGGDPATLREEDFHNKNTDEPVQITVRFGDLSQDAQDDFSDYCRQGKLVVSAVAKFNASTGTAEVIQYGERLVMKDFAPYFDAAGDRVPVPELAKIYEEIRKRFSELPATKTGRQMGDNLRAYEAEHPGLCELRRSQDQFYGVSKGQNRLERHVQWVYVPAVKDACQEDREGAKTALGKLLERTVRQKLDFSSALDEIRAEACGRYDALLSKSRGALDEISTALTERLRQWAHPGVEVQLEWDQDRDGAVRVLAPFARANAKEQEYVGALAQFGHGLQRAYLLALLQELSESATDSGPTLILACEEPELYQHPPQARHLYGVLTDLAEQNAQVLLSTHSPYFVSGHEFARIRVIRKKGGNSQAFWTTVSVVVDQMEKAGWRAAPALPGVLAQIHQTLQPVLSEMFFASTIVFVEGREDVAFVSTHMALSGRWEDYRATRCHIVPVGGKTDMIRPLAIANCLGIPAFAVFDADGPAPDKADERDERQRLNLALLRLCSVAKPEAFPNDTLWHERCVMWPRNITTVVRDELGEYEWGRFAETVRDEFGGTVSPKNPLYIARCLEVASEQGRTCESLERLCDAILNFARKQT